MTGPEDQDEVLERGRVAHELAADGADLEPLERVELCVYPDRGPSGRKHALPPDEMTRLAVRGGRASHAKGTAHKFTSETGRAAGKLGGVAVHAKRRARAQ